MSSTRSGLEYLDIGRARLTEMTTRLSLAILDGVHAGAHVPLGHQAADIGDDPENAIVLIGDGLTAHHATIEPAGCLGRQLRVTARQAALDIENFGRLEAGHQVDVPLPATLTVAGAKLHIANEIKLPVNSRTMTIAAVFALAALAGLALNGLHVTDAWAVNRVQEAPIASPLHSEAEMNAAAQHVRELMKSEGLTPGVTVTAKGADSVTLTGRVIGPEAIAHWRRALMQLDNNATLPPIVNSVTVLENAPRAPKIASVWRDDHPRVFLADGKSLTLGASTADGWRLQKIQKSSVEFVSPDGLIVSVNI
jgi:hypothetical protein